MFSFLFVVIREGSLQADPGLAGLQSELAERSREYRTGLRNEEREQADQSKALLASRETQFARTELHNSLQVLFLTAYIIISIWMRIQVQGKLYLDLDTGVDNSNQDMFSEMSYI